MSNIFKKTFSIELGPCSRRFFALGMTGSMSLKKSGTDSFTPPLGLDTCRKIVVSAQRSLNHGRSCTYARKVDVKAA